MVINIEYFINKLSKMSSVSTRTLRYYNEIGLLEPSRLTSSGYRIYGKCQVDKLHQILLYRELGFSLEDIKKLLNNPNFDKKIAFDYHLSALQEKRKKLDMLILNVTNSINAFKGENTMTDHEKFNGFKKKLVGENEKKHGKEIRAKYGNKTIDETNSRFMELSKSQYDDGEKLLLEFEKVLKSAFDTGNPAGVLAQKACNMHKQWLSIYYPKYSNEYHIGLAQMYVDDQRFRINYDKIAIGCAEFLRDAINIYCK
ncbi:MAG: MerR family transcriptional regulator [Oscillospiraceae bacterium]